MSKSTAIVWLRRDLRLSDHPALCQALEDHDQVLLLYIHAPDEEAPWEPGAASRWWLHHSLDAFQTSLHGTGAKLVIRRGRSLDILTGLCKQLDAAAVYWNRLYEPTIVKRDTEIKQALKDAGLDAFSCNGALLREPWDINTGSGEMYKVYTPFSKKYFELGDPDEPLPAPERIPSVHLEVEGEALEDLALLPDIEWDQGISKAWEPGERSAVARLQTFMEDAMANYSDGRDIPGEDGVSRLSPHLHFGELSPRQVWHDVVFHGEQSADDGGSSASELVRPYLRQLIWRDFAHHILYHRPETDQEAFNPKFDSFPWEQDETMLHAWQRGKTGIPMVDAGMRELWHTGWMHNRVRMLVASLLTKNGLIHWTEGARWFWDTLVDANLANNSMGWQWTAGTGVDAAPYFRIFNPALQGERFDKNGEYVKQWVPELSDLPAKHLHEPWNAPEKVLKEAGVKLGEDYPEPIVDLKASRKEALERFKALGGGD